MFINQFSPPVRTSIDLLQPFYALLKEVYNASVVGCVPEEELFASGLSQLLSTKIIAESDREAS